jgi:hypothetical protein
VLLPESSSRACCSFEICASISAIIRLTSIVLSPGRGRRSGFTPQLEIRNFVKN